jgi:hypothetical protein
MKILVKIPSQIAEAQKPGSPPRIPLHSNILAIKACLAFVLPGNI